MRNILVPIIIALTLWLLLRAVWMRTASAAAKIRRRPGGMELLAMRALANAPLRRLSDVDEDRHGVRGSIIGRIILFGYTWSVIHHMLGGIRHLIWDTGRGFGPNEREWLAAANLVGSIAITVVLWIVGLLAMGGPR